MTARLRAFLDRYFYFSMSILISVVVTYGFSLTIGKNLIHPALPRPGLLYFHAAVFFGWLIFYILQSALVRTRNLKIHKTLGWFGVALGATIVVLGISTAITMERFHIYQQHRSLDAGDISIPFNDIACFAVTFTLAILWRKRPEYHRRLILLASAALSAAGWGRYPLPLVGFYLGVDLFIVLGIIRDLIINRRVHKVYVWGLPAFLVGQAIALTITIKQPHFFVEFMKLLVG
jgi:hypothetical protein